MTKEKIMSLKRYYPYLKIYTYVCNVWVKLRWFHLPLFLHPPTWILEGKCREGEMKSTYFYSSITYVYLQIWIVSFNNIIFDFGLQLSCRQGVFNQINLKMIYVWKYGTMSKTNIFWIHPKPEKNRASSKVCIWDLLLPLKKDYEGWRGDILYNIVAVSQKEK